MRAARHGGRGLPRGLAGALGGGGAWRCERSPQLRPGGSRGRRRPSCLEEEVSVCAAWRRWPGSEGAVLAPGDLGVSD